MTPIEVQIIPTADEVIDRAKAATHEAMLYYLRVQGRYPSTGDALREMTDLLAMACAAALVEDIRGIAKAKAIPDPTA